MVKYLPVLQNPLNGESPEGPEDTLWSMVLKRGISSSGRPYPSVGLQVPTFSAQFGNMIYEPEEMTFFSFAVNVFMELPRLPGPTLKEPAARYQGAFILSFMDDVPLGQDNWDKMPEDVKMYIYDHAPQLFEGLPPFTKCPVIPAVGLYFQNWDMNMLGVLDDLKFGTASLSPLTPMKTRNDAINTDVKEKELDQLVRFG
jgi:hypothetical protein